MQEKKSTNPPKFQVVQSLRNPGSYACEAIDYDNEGIVIIVEFLAHDSRELAEEYAAWKNSELYTQPATSATTVSTHV